MSEYPTTFMRVREKFHAARTADTAKAYADQALKDRADDKPVRVAVAAELRHAGYDAEAARVEK